MSPTVLVTGANGFVGRAACRSLTQAGHRVRRAVRQIASDLDASADTVAIGDIAEPKDWQPAFEGVDVVLHLAARAHVMPGSDAAADPAATYRRTNVAGTESLARAAAGAGVRRLVFVSSVKVNGEATGGQPFRETDPPQPEDDYGRSKWEAEQRLHAIGAETGLEIVIVRPPLVYGPGVRGNLVRLLQIVDRGVPLPFGCIDNQRSIIGVGNLANALCVCVAHPGAAGECFLVSDGTDLSTPALVRLLADALGRPARLLSVPAPLLAFAARIAGFAALTRLTGSLQVDSTHIRERLGWRPPHPVNHEIAAMAEAYRSATRAPRHHRL